MTSPLETALLDAAGVDVNDVLATVYCKQAGCEQERRYTRGLAAGLCSEHGRPILSEHGRRAVSRRRHHVSTGRVAAGGAAELAQAIVRSAREYDRAAKRVRQAEQLRLEARRNLAETIRALVLHVREDEPR